MNKHRAAEEKTELTPNQIVLHDFVKEKLQEGEHIETIKYMIKDFVDERGFYSQQDIDKAIDYAIENDIKILPKGNKDDSEDISAKKQNVFKDNALSKDTDEKSLDEEQKRFLLFLKENKNSNFNTVDVYNALGLSARKGNKCKNELMDKALIKVEEIKNSRGWKKIIKIV